MRRASLGLLLISIVGATGFAVFWVFFRSGQSATGADAELSRLSKVSGAVTYHARYETADAADPNAIGSIAFYSRPGTGLRFDLSTPLAPDDDAKQDVDVLKSGDIFIVNRSLPETYVSCRTLRKSCRVADGLERLSIVSFLTLFRFDSPFLDEPHTVRRGDDIMAAGETAKCFIISKRAPTQSEQATAQASESGRDAALPKTVCYTNDGIPLGGLLSDSRPNTNWLKAVQVERVVDSAVFNPPFPMVASVYDRTPTATPSR